MRPYDGIDEQLFNRALLCFDSGRWLEAEQSFREYLLYNPSCAEAHANRAICLIHLGDQAEAYAESAEAIRLDPEHGFSFYTRAMVIMNDIVGRYLVLAIPLYIRAERAINEALRLEPENASYHELAAALAFMFGRTRLSLKRISLATEFEPNKSSLWEMKAEVLLSLRRAKEALATVDIALSLEPDCASCHRIRGKILGIQNNLAGALAQLGEALCIYPHSTSPCNSALDELHQTAENRTRFKELFFPPTASLKLKELAARSEPELRYENMHLLRQRPVDKFVATSIAVGFGLTTLLAYFGAFETQVPGKAGTLSALAFVMALLGCWWLASIHFRRVVWNDECFYARDEFARVRQVRWRELKSVEFNSDYFIFLSQQGHRFKIGGDLRGWALFAKQVMIAMQENEARPPAADKTELQKIVKNVNFNDEAVFVAEFPETVKGTNKFCIIGFGILLAFWTLVLVTTDKSKYDQSTTIMFLVQIGFFALLLLLCIVYRFYETRLTVVWSETIVTGCDLNGRRHTFSWEDISGVSRLPGDGLKVLTRQGNYIVLYPKMAGFRAFTLRLSKELRRLSVPTKD